MMSVIPRYTFMHDCNYKQLYADMPYVCIILTIAVASLHIEKAI